MKYKLILLLCLLSFVSNSQVLNLDCNIEVSCPDQNITDTNTKNTNVSVTGTTTKELRIFDSDGNSVSTNFVDQNDIPNNTTISLIAGTGLNGGGTFNLNQGTASTITFNLDAITWSDLTGTVPNISIFNNDANYLTASENIYTTNGTLPDDRTATVADDFNFVGTSATSDVWFTNLHIQGRSVNEAAFTNNASFQTYSATDSGFDYVGYRGSTSALANDGTTIVGGETNLYIKTPNTYAGTATVGQVARLQNTTGLIEYEDFSFANLDGLPTINVTSSDGTVSGVLNLSTNTLMLQATTGGGGGGGNVADMITNVAPSGNNLVFTGQNGAFNGSVSLAGLSVNWSQLTGTAPNVSTFNNDANYITTESQNLFRDVSVSQTWTGGVINQNGTITASTPTDEIVFAPKNSNSTVEFVGNQILIGAKNEHFLNTDLTTNQSRNHSTTGDAWRLNHTQNGITTGLWIDDTGSRFARSGSIGLYFSDDEIYLRHDDQAFQLIDVNGVENYRFTLNNNPTSDNGLPIYASIALAQSDANLYKGSLFLVSSDLNDVKIKS